MLLTVLMNIEPKPTSGYFSFLLFNTFLSVNKFKAHHITHSKYRTYCKCILNKNTYCFYVIKNNILKSE